MRESSHGAELARALGEKHHADLGEFTLRLLRDGKIEKSYVAKLKDDDLVDGARRFLLASKMLASNYTGPKRDLVKWRDKLYDFHIAHSKLVFFKPEHIKRLEDEAGVPKTAWEKIKRFVAQDEFAPNDVKQICREEMNHLFRVFGFPKADRGMVRKKFRNVIFLRNYERSVIQKSSISPTSYNPEYNVITFDPFEGKRGIRQSMQEEIGHFVNNEMAPQHSKKKSFAGSTEFVAPLFRFSVTPPKKRWQVRKEHSKLKNKSPEAYLKQAKHTMKSNKLIMDRVFELFEDRVMGDSARPENERKAQLDLINESKELVSRTHKEALRASSRGKTTFKKIRSLRDTFLHVALKTNEIGDSIRKRAEPLGLHDMADRVEGFFDFFFDSHLKMDEWAAKNWDYNRNIRSAKLHKGYDDADRVVAAGLHTEIIKRYGHRLFSMPPKDVFRIAREYRRKADKKLKEAEVSKSVRK